jgi:hypothetical protein
MTALTYGFLAALACSFVAALAYVDETASTDIFGQLGHKLLRQLQQTF